MGMAMSEQDFRKQQEAFLNTAHRLDETLTKLSDLRAAADELAEAVEAYFNFDTHSTAPFAPVEDEMGDALQAYREVRGE